MPRPSETRRDLPTYINSTYDSIPDSTSDSVLDILPDISSDSVRGSLSEQNFVGRLDFYCVHVAKFWL